MDEHTGRPASPHKGIDVSCIGETMVLLVPDPPAPPLEASTFRRSVGGAESNVAINLARRGRRTSWVSAVGDDAFGTYVHDVVRQEGVDCDCVRVVPGRRTGLYVKEFDDLGTSVTYYRDGSAATTLGPDDAAVVRARPPRILHSSGITAVLSDDAGALLRDLFTAPPPGTVRSFDVNYRPRLHTNGGATLIRELANSSDVVFCGVDEAEALWGVDEVDAVPSLFPRAACVVVKQGAAGATAYRDGHAWHAPAPEVTVVEPVGAGDAFAAGFLDGLLDEADVPECLARGTILAGQALRVHGDLPAREPSA